MVNIIWAFFIIVGSVFAIVTGKTDVLNDTILTSAKDSLEMLFKIFPVMALWLGIMNIASVSGLLAKISKKLSRVLGFLFPEIPIGDESLSLIASNIVINMFGLGNAATPFGLKAMARLQELNKKKDVASRSMITFLVINTSGVTIIPTTVISLRMMYGSANPTEIIFASVLATSIATIVGIIIDRWLAKRHD